MNIEKLKYPIGKINYPIQITSTDIKNWILTIKELPNKISQEISNLPFEAFDYKYRPNGWSIKQVVAHCLDSHINSMIRFKLALTEENPTIKPYAEDKWAELNDTLNYDVKENLETLKNIHKRWVFLLENLTEDQFNRTFIHPVGNETISLKENLCIYDWHCKHHLQHIINAKKFKY